MLARNSAESMMEIYSSLDSAPESLDRELFLSIKLFAYRQIIADFTRLALVLLSTIGGNASEHVITAMITVFLSELDHIKYLALEPSEDIAFTFPELAENDIEACSVDFSKKLDIRPLHLIMREVYYSFEPIIALNNCK